MINNKIDSIFGTVGVFAGWIILAFGIYSCFYSLIGISTVIVGLFLAFTNTSTKIDFENRKAKFSNNLFGIFSVGYWTDITSGMSLSLQKTTKSQNIFAFSNQKTTNTTQDYRIMLINEKGNVIMTLKRFDKKEDAENEIAELTKKLKITS